MANKKRQLLTVKMSSDLYINFKTAADLRGASPSSLVHQFAARVVREEQMRNPGLFDLKREEARREFEANSAAKKKKAGESPGSQDEVGDDTK